MTNIAEVIGWKFNNQPGMRCAQDSNGVMQIVEFPGGIPSVALQTQWTQEYEAWKAASNQSAAECEQGLNVSKMARLDFEVKFDMENRMRARENLQPVTRQQYLNALVNRYKNLP